MQEFFQELEKKDVMLIADYLDRVVESQLHRLTENARMASASNEVVSRESMLLATLNEELLAVQTYLNSLEEEQTDPVDTEK